ncbi:Isochorismate synthase / Menaquinone-specific isochorismate synthase [Lunatimonas lonarensis]|uniref:Isochorismate synthase / Menaquinone-specific isochorismate synthase n=1 Tax=Lunatimonas lonarensis TaxID=1232681 RepID=R7ZQP3_9BACT|nr:chorismate-binding protein [Lunatimonas lonarensis]EON76435.1 Isochorismate synthase / Menaquinone-specific isochorismate synthase [Lunatimonas lonarensis]
MSTVAAKKTVSVVEFLEAIFLSALEGDVQFAVWRKPGTSKIEVVLDSNGNATQVIPHLEQLPSGFILHPFADTKSAYFIPAETYFSFDLEADTAYELPENLVSGFDEHSFTSGETIRQLLKKRISSETGDTKEPTAKEAFLAMVEEAKQEILVGKLFKVVTARTKHCPLPTRFDLVQTFLALCAAYPNSFVNFFRIPGIGTWLGATPELLIRTKGKLFHTMALAGTQRAVGDNPVKNTAWTQKEIEEQALVSRYIVSCFKKIRLREYDEIGPKTSMAGNLLHLKSDFFVDMKATGFPELGTVMLDLLHPTSAVCGMPKETAHQFIETHEGFERGFFAGYLGPVNIGGETSIFVNLRCGQLRGDQVILYAGAGITEDSEPEKEWEETEMKCDIIRRFLLKPELS